MAKVKVGRLLGTAASFIPGVGPYIGAADALLSAGKGSKAAKTAGIPLGLLTPLVQNLVSRMPQSNALMDLVGSSARRLMAENQAVNESALLDQFQEDAINRLLPRAVESAASGPLASLVSRGLTTSSSLAGNVVARATQDAVQQLLTEIMQRRLALPAQKAARDIAVLNALGQMAGFLDPTQRLAALIPGLSESALGQAKIMASDRESQAKGISNLLKNLDPAKDWAEFNKWRKKTF